MHLLKVRTKIALVASKWLGVIIWSRRIWKGRSCAYGLKWVLCDGLYFNWVDCQPPTRDANNDILVDVARCRRSLYRPTLGGQSMAPSEMKHVVSQHRNYLLLGSLVATLPLLLLGPGFSCLSGVQLPSSPTRVPETVRRPAIRVPSGLTDLKRRPYPYTSTYIHLYTLPNTHIHDNQEKPTPFCYREI